MARILIADDALFMRTILKNLLEKNGHTVIGEAGNGNEAYELYKELKPDVVTMDITMPECDGLHGLHKIINDYPDARIIMCSAMGQQIMVLDAIKTGAKDFIVKPFDTTRVLDSINKALQ